MGRGSGRVRATKPRTRRRASISTRRSSASAITSRVVVALFGDDELALLHQAELAIDALAFLPEPCCHPTHVAVLHRALLLTMPAGENSGWCGGLQASGIYKAGFVV